MGNAGQLLADTLMQIVVGMQPMVQRADTILGTVNGLSAELPAVITQLQRDLVEIEVVLKSLQQHSLMRRAVQRHKATQTPAPPPISNQVSP
jgi:translation initiation factor 2 gamma subunit (eIF-2gamma)